MIGLHVLRVRSLRRLFRRSRLKRKDFSKNMAWRRSCGGDRGYTLVGLLVAIAIFAIFLAMAMTTLVAMNGSSLGSNRLGISSEDVQASFVTLARYLEYAVPPSALSKFSLTSQACRSLSSSAFVETSQGTSLTSGTVESIEFCSFGTENSNGLPNLYELEICPKAQGVLKLLELSTSSGSPTTTLLVDQGRVICGSAGGPTSYMAFCKSPPSLSMSNSQTLPSGCSLSPPSTSNDPYVYLSIAVRAVPQRSDGHGLGTAPPTRLTRLIKIKNVMGGD